MPHISDPVELKKFFEENFVLKTSELAMLLNVSPSTVKLWKKRCGIKPGKRTFLVGYIKQKRKVKKVKDSKIWNNKEWFEEQYLKNEVGCATIGRMIDKSIGFVWGRLKKYKIPLRSHAEAAESKNKCCTKEWLEEFYVKRALPIRRCAELASVCTYTIYNWLIKFKISIRDPIEGHPSNLFSDLPKD